MLSKEHIEAFCDQVSRLFPKRGDDGEFIHSAKSVTFQVTEACNLACTYCYQINKTHKRMSFETAKEFIDKLFKNEIEYMTTDNTNNITFEFIGGEPLLEIELIDSIVSYIYDKMIMLDHPWLHRSSFYCTSNGVLYHSEKVQKFLHKWEGKFMVAITLDGNKELHDKCRLFPDGGPSYDIVEKAIKEINSRRTYGTSSKITISNDNVPYIYDAFINMVNIGYHDVSANCVFEDVWTIDLAKVYYSQLIKIADYMLDNNLESRIYFSIFNDRDYEPMDPENADHERNYCGSTSSMLAINPDGNIYPCLRFMESSLGSDAPPFIIGNVHDGVAKHKDEVQRLTCMNCITRRSQSDDKCYNCPVAGGCRSCTGLNYQLFNDPDKRSTYICAMHMVESLANTYFFNKYYAKVNSDKRKHVYLPKEDALTLITSEEYDKLINMSKLPD